MNDPNTPRPPIKGRLRAITETWTSEDGKIRVTLKRSFDKEITLRPLAPVIDARAEFEGRPLRFGWDPTVLADLRRKCASVPVEDGAERMPPELFEEFQRRRPKIEFLASRMDDGRVLISVATRPGNDVPEPVIEDIARLLELLHHLQPNTIYPPEAQERLRHLLRERFPSLPRVDEDRLLEAVFRVLREPAVANGHVAD